MRQPLIIYHSNCWDGLGAAWSFKQVYPEAEYHAAIHDEIAPDVKNKDVYILDFAYKRPIIQDLHARAKSLLVLDHHETAEADLRGLNYCVYDLKRSGAGIAWDYLFPDKPRPWFISYIEDRDLWSFKLPSSEILNAAIATYPKDFSTLEYLAQIPWDEQLSGEEIQKLIRIGSPIINYRNQLIDAALLPMKIINFEGYQIPIVNTSILQSEIGNRLCKDYPFALMWFQDKNETYVYSLRSTEINIGAIAAKYGGGGHRLAAGFRLKYLLS